MQIDWPVFNRRNPSALLTNLAQIQAPRKAEHAFIERLNAQPVDQQQNYLNEWLCEQVCAVLALPKTTAIEPRERLFDFGLDSLMAVELKNRLDHATAKKLRSTLIFDYPTLETLGRYLAEQLLVAAPQQPPQAQQEPDLFELNDLLDALEKSSDDEAIQRLMN
jgi:myxalamid-type polyketide synthase MxaB